MPRPRLCCFLALALQASVATGCASYVGGNVRSHEVPGLEEVRLAEPGRRGEPLLRARWARSGGTCSEVAARALQELVREAEAVGAEGVHDAEFRGRFFWGSRVRCRRDLFRTSVEVRGRATNPATGEGS